MTSGIHIHVGSGGNAAFGNVVQGDGNTVQASGVQASVAQRFDEFLARLPAQARPFHRPAAEVEGLTREIERLKQEAVAPRPNTDVGHGILKSIHGRFPWAWPAVVELLKGAWPVLLTVFIG